MPHRSARTAAVVQPDDHVVVRREIAGGNPVDRCNTAPIGLVDMFNDQIHYHRRAGNGDSVRLLSEYAGKRILDFGCGAAPARAIIERAGGKWVGVDIAGSGATVRCDGHRLPLHDRTFDAIIAHAVFQHLLDPFAAVRELARVCKPGGELVGYVAFLEPFHLSHFHYSHTGLEHLLQSGGFRLTDCIPSRPGIEKLFEELLFPRRIPYLTKGVSMCIRSGLYLVKRGLHFAAAVWLVFKNESRSMRQKKLSAYDLLLEFGFAGGFLFRAVRASGAQAWGTAERAARHGTE